MSVKVEAGDPASVSENPPPTTPPRVKEPSPTAMVVLAPRLMLLLMVLLLLINLYHLIDLFYPIKSLNLMHEMLIDVLLFLLN